MIVVALLFSIVGILVILTYKNTNGRIRRIPTRTQESLQELARSNRDAADYA